MRQIVLDTETTGLAVKDRHRIIEIGCVELINRRLTGNNLHFYLNPERKIDKGAVEVHGLTSDFLSDKPLFTDIAIELVDYIKDAELIIHNAPFDVSFLNYEFKLAGSPYKKIKNYCEVLDTLKLARLKHPGQHNSLDALCRRYQVDNAKRDLHGALLDAELLAQVYLHMTGGQAQLFAQDNQTQTQRMNAVNAQQQHAELVTIQPNAAELAAHQATLKTMQEKGQCLWAEKAVADTGE
ncbi:MAG: DNA polymerase III subunit epsilon [Gammaproteobacteria bacterium]|nr:DNA polymerase III subunit epsilon [Gammaproteobacteria bacterium]